MLRYGANKFVIGFNLNAYIKLAVIKPFVHPKHILFAFYDLEICCFIMLRVHSCRSSHEKH
jgi:hypothetical protein